MSLTAGCGRSSDATAAQPWLGLNDNVGRTLGSATRFVDRGIVYDHDMDIVAGETPTTSGCTDWVPGWQASHFFNPRAPLGVFDRALRAGTIPVVTIDYCGSGDDYGQCQTHDVLAAGKFPFLSRCLPTATNPAPYDIASYVSGFVATAKAMLGYAAAHDPGRQVLFEVTNEPWGYGSPGASEQATAAAYADLVVALLPAAAAAGIPLSDIYVGAENDTANWVGLMYGAQPALRKAVQGWYFHPYGLPGDYLNGIEGVADVRARYEQYSGWSNVIASELGFCVTPHPPAAGGLPPSEDVCRENLDELATRSNFQAAQWLTQTLDEALPMHLAGWLRAVIVWDRGYAQPSLPRLARLGYSGIENDGWAMQTPAGALTAQGQALDAFARAGTGLPTAGPAFMRSKSTGNQALAYVGTDGMLRASAFSARRHAWTATTHLYGEPIAPDTTPALAASAGRRPFRRETIVYTGADDRIWSWTRSGSRWREARIGGAVAAGSSPALGAAPAQGEAWITYVGPSGRLQQWVWQRHRRRWRYAALGGEPAAPHSSPVTAALLKGRAPVVYVGADHKLWAWEWSGGHGHNRELGGYVAASTSPAAVSDNGGSEITITYVGPNWVLWRCVWDRSTGAVTNFALGGEPAAIDTSPAPIQLPGQTPIFYVGADDRVWDFSWSGGRWQNGSVGDQAAPGSTLSAAQDPSTGELWVDLNGNDGGIDQLHWVPGAATWSQATIAAHAG